ncbi:unnamed protein product [Adineta steineri]|uniref:NAD(P)(+)--arginine ADP-ribosyltransferase n=1 Tax=Adineta steineri TaxID=433720 RepID=A0A818W0A2_9BILA|nr:unnamed protein product [Adineta steineri]CAF3718735.1 unnamed protein product [Adineta steineri]
MASKHTGNSPVASNRSIRRFQDITNDSGTNILIWLDSDVNSYVENIEIQKKLKQIIKQFKIFYKLDECVNYLADLVNQNIVLIVSDLFESTVISTINDFAQIKAVYVFDVDNKVTETCTKEYEKLKGIYTKLEDLITAVLADEHVRAQVDSHAVVMNVYSTENNVNTSEERDSKNALFMYFQLLIDILLQMTNDGNVTAKQDLIGHFKRIYEGNTAEQRVIEEFENEYRPDKAIWWYSRPSFLYHTLNKALRESSYEVLLALRFYINDLYEQLKFEHEKFLNSYNNDDDPILRVYRGQAISNQELYYIRKNVGQYISMQSFLSTSVTHETALFFAQASAIPSDEKTRIVFQFNIDTHMKNTKPYVNIKNLSYFPEEEEVLIMIGSIFKIIQIEYKEHEQTWFSILSLCSGDEYELKDLMKEMKEEVEAGIGSLGYLLYNQGEYEKATNYFQQLLLDPTTDIFDKGQCYRGLGAIDIALKDYDSALENFQKEFDLYTEEDDQENIATTYAKIGEVYFFKKDFDSALSYEHKALNILLSLDSFEISDIYRTIANVYHDKEDFNLALEYYEKALEVDRQYLPQNHYNFGITYECIGSNYQNSHDCAKAIEYFSKAREVYLKSLPPTHSRIITLEQSINEAKTEQNSN